MIDLRRTTDFVEEVPASREQHDATAIIVAALRRPVA